MSESLAQPVQPEYFDDVIGLESVRTEADIPLDSRLAPDDPVRQQLEAVGLMGEPVMRFRAGKQEFAVIDISDTPKKGIHDNYFPFREGFKPLDVSPDNFEPALGDTPTLVLVHFEDTNVVCRAVRPFQPISIGRTAYRTDRKSSRFSYGDDLTISSNHAALLFDPETRSIQFTSTKALNGTKLTYQTNPQLPEAESIAYTPTLAVEIGKVIIGADAGSKEAANETHVSREQGMMIGDQLERGVINLSRKEKLNAHDRVFLNELVASGSKAVQNLLDSGVRLPTQSEARLNIRDLVTSARTVLQEHGAVGDVPKVTQLYAIGQLKPRDLSSILNKMGVQGLPDSAHFHEQIPYEDFAKHLSILIKDMANENNGFPVTEHVAGKLEKILQAYDEAFLAKA